MTDKIFVRKIEENLWQWRETDAQNEWVNDTFYTGDVNLLRESVAGRHVCLILPGSAIVSRITEAAIKDRRQLLKVLPYDLEEDIVEPVEDMQFAFGTVYEGQIPVAYGDYEMMAHDIKLLEDQGADVQRCVVEYLQIPSEPETWHLMLENDMVIGHLDKGMGFTAERAYLPHYLLGLIDEYNFPKRLVIFGDDQSELARLKALFPETLLKNDDIEMVEHEATFWDVLDPHSLPYMDFRTGRLARKLPFAQWWQDWKYPAIASAAAFLIAVGATWLAQQQASTERKQIMAQTDAIYRQAVPDGRITEPARQLKRLLGDAGVSGDGSSVAALLAAITPSVKSTDNVSIRNFRYSMDNGTLQLNIEADSFETFETLRKKIADSGLAAEIKSANVYGDVHQAQLRVSEEAG